MPRKRTLNKHTALSKGAEGALTATEVAAAVDSIRDSKQPPWPPESVWEFDCPTGTYRNKVLDIFFNDWINDRCVFYPHARIVDGLGKKAGEFVTLTRIAQDFTLPKPLKECEPIDEAYTLSPVHLKVQEWGSAMPYQSLAENFGCFNPDDAVQARLLDRGVLIRDGIAASAFKQTPFKFVPFEVVPPHPPNFSEGRFIEDGVLTEPAWTGLRARIAARLGLDNRKGIKSSRTVGIYDFKEFSTLLSEVYKTPTINGCYYAFVGHNVARLLLSDFNFEAYWKYTGDYADRPTRCLNEAPVRGEIGRLVSYGEETPEVRFIQVNHKHLLGPDEAIIFGEDAVAVVESVPLHLRAAMPADFGRSKAIALYGIAACGPIWTSAKPGEVRTLHITSGPDIDPFGKQLRDNLRGRWYAFKHRQRVKVATFVRRIADYIDGHETAGIYETDEGEEEDE